MTIARLTLNTPRLTEPLANAADDELRAHVQRALSSSYELDCEIGRGGMGLVYRAQDLKLKRQVAIKVLPPELAFRSDIRARFIREAQTAANLTHPNIVPIYGVDDHPQLPFFTMAYVDGENLAKRLHERGVLTIEETRRILRDVADALAYAHGRGVIHRDIKPDNILLDKETGRPMVTDFGIARAMDGSGGSRLTATGMAIGTPAYMSPEQAAGEREVDGRSDLYSLGILGYQMLTGEPPFTAASTPAMLVKHISEQPVPVQQRRNDVPPDLARCVMILLEKDPNNRFPNATALLAALDNREAPPMPVRERAPMPPVLNSEPRFDSSRDYSRQQSYSNPPYSPAGYGASERNSLMGHNPTVDDLRRWDAPQVQRFRKKLMPYLYVNGVIVVISVFAGKDFLPITGLWSIYIAFKYAKLWSENYDWRDVFRQPREKEVMEVLEEVGDSVKALYDMGTRDRLRAGREQRRLAARGMVSPVAAAASYDQRNFSGSNGERVRQALADRDEIFMRLKSLGSSLPETQRQEVARSATALADKVQALAYALEESSRTDTAGAREQLEREITTLENAANPLERGSEERVRRLAFLKRQRRVLVETDERKETGAAKLETCALALQNMRFDLMRLGASPQMHQHITGLANQAMSLAESVDAALYVADEMGKATGRASGGRRTGAERG